MTTANTIPATLNSYDREAIEPHITDWERRHGKLQTAPIAKWEVHADGRSRWFPAKIVDVIFADAHGQVRLDSQTGEVTVTINPDNKPKLADAPPVSVNPDAPYLGMQPLQEKAA
jgi:hypothetical protein